MDQYGYQQNNPNYNVNTVHPIIQNSQDYLPYKKYVSIHSEDRDLIKYPNSNTFAIELPEDYLNVSSMRLVQWTFPANYNVFSVTNGNILMTFKISNPYNPSEFGVASIYYSRIFQALWLTSSEPYEIIIEEGFYNPIQMSTELTNKFNHVVTLRIKQYFIENGWTDTLDEFNLNGGYNRFIIVYNSVSLKLWFGNTTDPFTLTNETVIEAKKLTSNLCEASGKNQFPDASDWGLPNYLGLSRCNVSSLNGSNISNSSSFSTYDDFIVPRFYYGDVTPGDDGYWLLPNLDLSGSQVNWIEPPYKVNLMGNAYIYMEIKGMNCIDETSPYNVNNYTLTTNNTNGIVNSSFAKMAVPSTPLSQWFDRDSVPYKMFYPPAERIRRLEFRFRYHNGALAQFGDFNFSFLLELTLCTPQIMRKTNTINYPNSGGSWR